MTIGTEEELERLKAVGSVVARTLRTMGALLEPGMTTQELDDAGAEMLAAAVRRISRGDLHRCE